MHPQRNILTRALGIDSGLDVDAWHVRPVVGDRWLLCSDGLFNEVSEPTIAAVLGATADPAAAAHELVRLANLGGGRDNITVLVVDVIEHDDHADTSHVVDTDPGASPAGAPPRATGRRRVDALAVGAAGPEPSGSREGEHQSSVGTLAAKGARRSTADRLRNTWRVLAFALAIVVVAVVVLVAWIVYDGGGTTTNDPPVVGTVSTSSSTSTTSTTSTIGETTTFPPTTTPQ